MMMMNTIERRRNNHSTLTTSLLMVLFLVLLGGVDRVQAQWSSSGGNTTTTDNVGIGTTSPTSGKLQVNSGSTGTAGYFTSSNTIATLLNLANSSTGGVTWNIQSVGSGVAG